MVKIFNAKESLAAVRLYVQLNRDDGIDTPFNMMTNFPKRTFQDAEYDMPLDALGKSCSCSAVRINDSRLKSHHPNFVYFF